MEGWRCGRHCSHQQEVLHATARALWHVKETGIAAGTGIQRRCEQQTHHTDAQRNKAGDASPTTTRHPHLWSCAMPQVGQPPFGVPYAMNTDVELSKWMPAIGNQQCSANHLLLQCSKINHGDLGTSFRAKNFCWRCGCQKSHHIGLDVPFGDSCENNCHRAECSKCFQKLELNACHQDGCIGPFCDKVPHNKSKWNKQFAETTRKTGIV